MTLGAILFVLGLISGFAVGSMANPRMGLASHLEGVMNGTFLLVVGLGWSRLELSESMQRITYWLLVYGTFANWLFVQLASMFGTSRMTPIAGAGYEGLPWQESLVSAGLLSVGITMLLGCGLLVWGFARKQHVDGRG